MNNNTSPNRDDSPDPVPVGIQYPDDSPAAIEVRNAWAELRDYNERTTAPPPEPQQGNTPIPASNWKYQLAVGRQILARQYKELTALTVVKGTAQ